MVALKRPRGDHQPGGPGRKQERRGGIETDPRLLGQRRHQGSRNAVVALKRMKALGSRIWRSMNQERRGGIETWPRASTLVSKKFEAGTPWWH